MSRVTASTEKSWGESLNEETRKQGLSWRAERKTLAEVEDDATRHTGEYSEGEEKNKLPSRQK